VEQAQMEWIAMEFQISAIPTLIFGVKRPAIIFLFKF
jgi:hypothetical protein